MTLTFTNFFWNVLRPTCVCCNDTAVISVTKVTIIGLSVVIVECVNHRGSYDSTFSLQAVSVKRLTCPFNPIINRHLHKYTQQYIYLYIIAHWYNFWEIKCPYSVSKISYFERQYIKTPVCSNNKTSAEKKAEWAHQVPDVWLFLSTIK